MLQNETLCKDAEQLVLAALLIEKNAMMRVVDILKPEMFFQPEHREIYACIESMTQMGKAVDLITVADALKNNPEVEKAGGISYLAETSGRLVSSIYDLDAIDSACRLLSQQSFYIDDTSQRSVSQIKSSAKRMGTVLFGYNESMTRIGGYGGK